MTTLKPEIKAELGQIFAKSESVVLSNNFMFNLMEYVDKLEQVARYADTAALLLKDTSPGKAEALEERVRRAIAACEILNTCKPQRQQS